MITGASAGLGRATAREFGRRGPWLACARAVSKVWAAMGFPSDATRAPKIDSTDKKPLRAIPYKELDIRLPWEIFDLTQELTTKGIQKFVADYRSTLKSA